VNRTRLLALASLLACVAAGRAQACNLSVTGLNLGIYDSFSGRPLDAEATVVVNCPVGVSYSVLLGPGAGSGGFFAPRLMRSADGEASLPYNVYADSAHTQVWGDGTGNTVVRTDVGTGLGQQFTLYARIPAGQSAAAGTYADTLSVTLNF
jgi:spore coat protein U domain-containing protein, fimbrial subunit CupE1/2/3/6